MNWYAITPMNWYAITPMNWYAWGRSSLPSTRAPACVRSNTSALLDVEGEGEPTEYVLVLADIITAIDKDKVVKYPYRLARYKYDKDKLDKYESACLCNIEIPSNEQVHVLELCVMMGDTTLH